ncbi:MAG: DNA polymerase III, subunit gamma and tau [Betaproteobacteria bacterium HGW-Betaproteobacteria-8]|nr:MAG: DNA polymerase III, subunit gamma and tau [Betaproteobacteria bacterium HGW-Betaproteobacteria-8]
MSYQVLARKWRPKSFETLVGQEHVVRALSNALDQQRLHHAYLFTGTRGVGKTTLSRILAKSLNCETGVTSKPCGQCSACLAIDKGSFIDYVEMDAASNRGVDDMTALLEKAVYAPTQGRYKVYMLDEVHQLTGHAFNAMLKTLEEPPAHVKFILATTDPQKVPVTVLSRCLQFNLRQMSGAAISEHLQSILGQEDIPFEPVALQLIARAANGSMRDALSLLDQAIAYGGNAVKEQEVRSMLGAIDQSYLFDLLDTLVTQDGASLMSYAQQMEQRSLSFEAALGDLAHLLYQIAVYQSAPEGLPQDLPEYPRLAALAQRLSAEQVQLFYQIALIGRRDIGLAPDEFAGFSMCLLRMLAFMPVESSSSKIDPRPTGKPTAAPVAEKPTATASVPAAPEQRQAAADPPPAKENLPVDNPANTASPPPALVFDGNWRRLVDQLKLGLARALAQNCELLRHDEHNFYLSVPEAHKHLLDQSYQEKLRTALVQHFGTNIKLHFEIGGTGNTPAAQISQEKAEIQSAAESAIREDDFVQALVRDFGAQIIPSSIKPIQ